MAGSSTRVLQSTILTVSLWAGLLGASAAHAQSELQQWHDVLYRPPSSNWHLATPDPEPELSGTRFVLQEQEPLHAIELDVTTLEAPQALAPSEVAERYWTERRASTRSDGALSDMKTGTRTIGGASYPSFSVRFTPASGPPITDVSELLVFPGDYDQRQRWMVVRWSDTHSGTAGPKALDELDGFVQNLSNVPLGSVLLTDDFSDPINGPLSFATSSEHYDVGYKEGELAIQKNDPTSDAIYVVSLPGTYADTSLAVDTHMQGSDYGSVEHLFCRRTSDGSYRVDVDQSDGSARLARIDTLNDNSDELVPWTTSSAIKLGPASNHLELVCRGGNIELDVNGTRVLSAHNTELTEGHGGIGAGAFSDADAISEVRFANLSLVQR